MVSETGGRVHGRDQILRRIYAVFGPLSARSSTSLIGPGHAQRRGGTSHAWPFWLRRCTLLIGKPAPRPAVSRPRTLPQGIDNLHLGSGIASLATMPGRRKPSSRLHYWSNGRPADGLAAGFKTILVYCVGPPVGIHRPRCWHNSALRLEDLPDWD